MQLSVTSASSNHWDHLTAICPSRSVTTNNSCFNVSIVIIIINIVKTFAVHIKHLVKCQKQYWKLVDNHTTSISWRPILVSFVPYPSITKQYNLIRLKSRGGLMWVPDLRSSITEACIYNILSSRLVNHTVVQSWSSSRCLDHSNTELPSVPPHKLLQPDKDNHRISLTVNIKTSITQWNLRNKDCNLHNW